MKEKLAIAVHAVRDPRTPLLAKLLLVFLLAYVISPIDLIPDFIPVLGLLDDMILVPAVISVVYLLLPETALADAKRHLPEAVDKQKLMRAGMLLVIVIWVLMVTICWWLFV